MSTVSPASPNAPSNEALMAASASAMSIAMLTPLPAARPSALITTGKVARSSICWACVNSRVVNARDSPLGMS